VLSPTKRRPNNFVSWQIRIRNTACHTRKSDKKRERKRREPFLLYSRANCLLVCVEPIATTAKRAKSLFLIFSCSRSKGLSLSKPYTWVRKYRENIKIAGGLDCFIEI